MSGSTTNLDLIATSQAQKEVTANALFDAASASMMLGRRASTCSALTWGYYGGGMIVSGVPTVIANGTVALTASSTNYVEADGNGVVTANVIDFTVGAYPLYKVVTGSATVTSYIDYRISYAVFTGNGTVTSVAASVPAEFAVAGSPITAAGTLAITKAVQNANKVWAGPTTGADAEPVFRALVQADLPAQPFDVHAFYPGIPTASAIVVRVPVARAVGFVADFVGSYGKASAAATASMAFDVQKNGSSIGTITFAAAASTATFTTAAGAAQTLAAGDVLSIIAPATPDATLADPGFVLAGTR
jgi:hypothetical protein